MLYCLYICGTAGTSILIGEAPRFMNAWIDFLLRGGGCPTDVRFLTVNTRVDGRYIALWRYSLVTGR